MSDYYVCITEYQLSHLSLLRSHDQFYDWIQHDTMIFPYRNQHSVLNFFAQQTLNPFSESHSRKLSVFVRLMLFNFFHFFMNVNFCAIQIKALMLLCSMLVVEVGFNVQEWVDTDKELDHTFLNAWWWYMGIVTSKELSYVAFQSKKG